ncbi:hypothetical protein AD945_01290 [Gluconobacter albidus]|uniref:Lysozyme n=1 Tax=Gluconobacter albidus TaxID=318683 RepID=A0A149TN60_9PROT|nr:lysozyme [Gluconobacter albidus]KXV50764.1 hypothetical protein AD945_01290 [Gluconobacter albidus]
MEISEKGLSIIQHYEGLRLTAYKDTTGIPTIGYGHTGPDVHMGMAITNSQATALLKNDLAVFSQMLNSKLAKPIEQWQFDALMSFLYNVGPGSSKKDGLFVLRNGKASTLWSCVQTDRMSAAATQFGLWNKAGGVVLSGLSHRRHTEAWLFSTGNVQFFN